MHEASSFEDDGIGSALRWLATVQHIAFVR